MGIFWGVCINPLSCSILITAGYAAPIASILSVIRGAPLPVPTWSLVSVTLISQPVSISEVSFLWNPARTCIIVFLVAFAFTLIMDSS